MADGFHFHGPTVITGSVIGIGAREAAKAERVKIAAWLRSIGQARYAKALEQREHMSDEDRQEEDRHVG